MTLGIVVGDNDTDDNGQEDSKNLWITNPGTSIFYNYEINERKIMKSDDEDIQTSEVEDNKKTAYNVSIDRYTTSMASPKILPSWIKKAKDGTIWFNQQQGNKIAHFDPAEQLLEEYWIPSQNKEWGTCDNEEKESINKNHNMTRGCGIANVLNFALKESDEKEEDEGEKNTVEEVWFTEWSANKIGRIDTEKDLPFNIDINEPDEALIIKRGESENIKLTLTTNEELIDHEYLQSEDATREYKKTKSSKLLDPTVYDDDLITMTAAGTFTSTGYFGNSTGFFDVPILLLNQNKNNDHDDEEENEQEISFVFTPSKDMIPGDYTLMLGAEDRSVSVLKAVKINVI
jgi:virginiamycin B lyase